MQLGGRPMPLRMKILVQLKYHWSVVKGSNARTKKEKSRNAIARLQRELDVIDSKITEKEFQQMRKEYLKRMASDT